MLTRASVGYSVYTHDTKGATMGETTPSQGPALRELVPLAVHALGPMPGAGSYDDWLAQIDRVALDLYFKMLDTSTLSKRITELDDCIKFVGVIQRVDIEPKSTRARIIVASATGREESEHLRTDRTDSRQGREIYEKAQGLVGHAVVVFKAMEPFTDPEQGARKVRICKYLLDLGPSTGAVPALQEPDGRSAEASPQSAPAGAQQNAPTPAAAAQAAGASAPSPTPASGTVQALRHELWAVLPSEWGSKEDLRGKVFTNLWQFVRTHDDGVVANHRDVLQLAEEARSVWRAIPESYSLAYRLACMTGLLGKVTRDEAGQVTNMDEVRNLATSSPAEGTPPAMKIMERYGSPQVVG